MNEAECLRKMVPPSKKRKCWRGGILQIQVTRACDLSCFGCTQGSNLGGKPVMMSVDEFEVACRSLEGYWGVVGMFGGNPAIHPKFGELCEVMRRYFPKEQRGIWCNNPRGKGAIMRETFDPNVSNLNVHTDMDAWAEFERDWPECSHVLKGEEDSEHSPWTVAMKDADRLPFPNGEFRENNVLNRNELISNCDVNQKWSAIVCKVPGAGVRCFVCEIMGTMAMLHPVGKEWPDLGLKPEPGWWRKSMTSFRGQVRHYCHNCGMPARQEGQLAIGGEKELVSQTHQEIFKPKDPSRLVQLTAEFGPQMRDKATNYIENGLDKLHHNE